MRMSYAGRVSCAVWLRVQRCLRFVCFRQCSLTRPLRAIGERCVWHRCWLPSAHFAFLLCVLVPCVLPLASIVSVLCARGNAVTAVQPLARPVWSVWKVIVRRGAGRVGCRRESVALDVFEWSRTTRPAYARVSGRVCGRPSAAHHACSFVGPCSELPLDWPCALTAADTKQYTNTQRFAYHSIVTVDIRLGLCGAVTLHGCPSPCSAFGVHCALLLPFHACAPNSKRSSSSTAPHPAHRAMSPTQRCECLCHRLTVCSCSGWLRT